MAFLLGRIGSFFITSDNPCVWFQSQASGCHRSIGVLVWRSAIFFVSHRPGRDGYFCVTDAHVQELNRRVVGFCGEQFVSKSAETRPYAPEPVSDVGETDTRVAYGEVLHPTTQNRVDLLDHLLHRPGAGSPEDVSELAEQGRHVSYPSVITAASIVPGDSDTVTKT
jgi:hypothetical protein